MKDQISIRLHITLGVKTPHCWRSCCVVDVLAVREGYTFSCIFSKSNNLYALCNCSSPPVSCPLCTAFSSFSDRPEPHTHFSGSHEPKLPQRPKWSRTFCAWKSLQHMTSDHWGLQRTLILLSKQEKELPTSPLMVLMLQRQIPIRDWVAADLSCAVPSVRWRSNWMLSWKVPVCYFSLTPDKK